MDHLIAFVAFPRSLGGVLHSPAPTLEFLQEAAAEPRLGPVYNLASRLVSTSRHVSAREPRTESRLQFCYGRLQLEIHDKNSETSGNKSHAYFTTDLLNVRLAFCSMSGLCFGIAATLRPIIIRVEMG